MIVDFDWDSYEDFLLRYGRRIDNNTVKRYFEHIGKPRKKGLCYCCMNPITDKRRYYCSEECTHEWYSLFVWPIIVRNISQRAEWRCEGCGKQLSSRDRKSPHIHHIVPISQGGHKFNPKNLQLLCVECHHEVHHEMSKAYELEQREIEYNRNQRKLDEWKTL